MSILYAQTMACGKMTMPSYCFSQDPPPLPHSTSGDPAAGQEGTSGIGHVTAQRSIPEDR